MIALKRVTRYLKGTRHFVKKLELDADVDKHVTRWDGFSDIDWAGSTEVTIEWCALRGWSTSPLFQWKTIFDSDELWNG